MRRKLLISLVVLGAIAVLVSLGSYAWFSDLETSSGNTFTAGTIEIWVDGQETWDTTYAVTHIIHHGGVHYERNLKPSQIGYIEFPIENRGNNRARIWKRISDTTSTEIELTGAELRHYSRYGDWDKKIEDYMDFDLTVISDSSPPVETEIIPESDPLDLKTVVGNWLYLGVLRPGETMTVRQSFHLREDTGTIDPDTGLPDTNWAQADQLVFTEQILGLQMTGVRGPTPRMPGF